MNNNRLLSNSPVRMWDYSCKWCASIGRITVRNFLGSRAPAEERLGDIPDISEYEQLNW